MSFHNSYCANAFVFQCVVGGYTEILLLLTYRYCQNLRLSPSSYYISCLNHANQWPSARTWTQWWCANAASMTAQPSKTTQQSSPLSKSHIGKSSPHKVKLSAMWDTASIVRLLTLTKHAALSKIIASQCHLSSRKILEQFIFFAHPKKKELFKKCVLSSILRLDIAISATTSCL